MQSNTGEIGGGNPPSGNPVHPPNGRPWNDTSSVHQHHTNQPHPVNQSNLNQDANYLNQGGIRPASSVHLSIHPYQQMPPSSSGSISQYQMTSFESSPYQTPSMLSTSNLPVQAQSSSQSSILANNYQPLSIAATNPSSQVRRDNIDNRQQQFQEH